MFENLSTLMEENTIYAQLKEEIVSHPKVLAYELSRYFSDLSNDESMLVRNPFAPQLATSLHKQSIPDGAQDEFIDIRNDSFAKDTFQKSRYHTFGVICYPYN